MEFVRQAVEEHRQSRRYQTARSARKYYEQENPTIARYEKLLYDAHGLAHRDLYAANHKIASGFFTFAVDQLCGYLLGNGVSFTQENTKGRLGKKTMPLDQQLMEAGQTALIEGAAYGFWNLDHVDVFGVLEYAPLEDEEDGAMKAGIRFWQVDPEKPRRFTLYEPDGYTDYIQRKGEDIQVYERKRPYKLLTSTSPADGSRIVAGENYPGFPIVPLKNNKKSRSYLCGKRNTVDALDLVTSGMVNNVDEGNLIYWVLVNCEGMDDLDDAQFIQQVKRTHVLHAEGDQGATAQPHSIEAPVQGNDAAISRLEKRLYTDFQIFDVSAVLAGNQTATAIRAMYVPMDLRADHFETQVTRFLLGILELAGIEDEPSYTRSKIINTQEETQTILMGADFLPRTYITEKLLILWGDGDKVKNLLAQMEAEELERFAPEPSRQEESGEDTPTAGEAIEAAEEATGKTLNGSQTSSLITVIKGLKSGDITEGQAVRILTTSIGVTREEALAIIRGEE
ncbi:phage portal protein [Acutalibacter sp. 1XD8-33]|uniref:phage portal protein n=1 Tax=Acutalibacter sp. 1XD8-33 TaxID=2320081 RepID=UPI000EA0C919|nr:phage portal protein [Acutalibacter sp. 1XD8-33]RKJ40197.1 phage portal protein [Acutalibacter sp. 1XD8-33]